MPVFFGPAPQPNALPDGRFALNKPADVEAVTVMFETDEDKLSALLPQGFTLATPVLSVAVRENGNIGNFSGLTYSLVDISVPVRYEGKRDHVRGDLVLVMYGNHTAPILGGRDVLGYSKIYADIPRFARNNNSIRASAYDEWGFKFLDVILSTSTERRRNPEAIKAIVTESEGKLNYKYIPATAEKGAGPRDWAPEVSYPTFNPKVWTAPKDYRYTLKKPETQVCAGTVTFHRPKPEDMPLYWHVGVYLASLPVKRYLGAQHSLYNDPSDFSHVYRAR